MDKFWMKLNGMRKALAPVILSIAGVIGVWIETGTLDVTTLRLFVASGFYALLVYAMPNDSTELRVVAKQGEIRHDPDPFVTPPPPTL